MLRLILISFLILKSFIPCAQTTQFVNGIVTDVAGKPLRGCSVYLSNTSYGSVTSASGEFFIKNLPDGKYQLVISAIGYEASVITISSEAYPKDLKVKLKNRSTELSEVVVEPVDKNGWSKWGKYFTDNFIGKTPNARQCRIINYKEIKFRFSKKNNKLTARCDKPLLIENTALGYSVRFQLVEFSADFNTNFILFVGYPYFVEMAAGDDFRRAAAWNKKRKEAYYGSLLHFMRATYKNQLNEEGYSIVAKDSLDNQTDLSSLEDLLTDQRDKSRTLLFADTLDVFYHRNGRRQVEISVIYLDSHDGIDIQQNGSYYSPKELITLNHWGAYEKLANMLPFNYQP
jgi:hypothetical protein